MDISHCLVVILKINRVNIYYVLPCQKGLADPTVFNSVGWNLLYVCFLFFCCCCSVFPGGVLTPSHHERPTAACCFLYYQFASPLLYNFSSYLMKHIHSLSLPLFLTTHTHTHTHTHRGCQPPLKWQQINTFSFLLITLASTFSILPQPAASLALVT